MKTQKIWREKEEVKLKELYEAGLTLPKIAEQLGRTKNSVSHRIHLLKEQMELTLRRRKTELKDIYYNTSNKEINKFKERQAKYKELSKDNYNLIGEYDKENELAGLTPTSRAGLIHDLALFGVYIKNKRLIELKVCDIEDYITHLKKRLSESSIRTHKSRIKGLYRYLVDKHGESKNILLVFNYLDKKRRGRKIDNGAVEAKPRLTKREIVKLVSAIKGNDKQAIRDRAIVASLYDCGSRCSEFIAIRNKDAQIDGKFPHYYLPMSKTKPRDSHILNFSLPYVMEWKKQHEFIDNQESAFFYSLSSSNYGEAVTDRTIALVLKKAQRIAGIKKTISPHIFRDSKAVHCAESGMTSAEANLLFGWGRGSSMFNYYSTISQNALRLREMERAGKLTEEQVQELKDERNAFVSRKCARCGKTSRPDEFVCSNCGLSLNKAEAEKVLTKENKEFGEMRQEMGEMKELFGKFLELEKSRLPPLLKKKWEEVEQNG